MRFQKINKIGFYPIVNRAELIKELLILGVKTLQIRIKDLEGENLENEIKNAVEISKQFNDSQLFINDRWELALKYNAFGVHLGQEDIDSVSTDDFQKIADTGIRIGISTHNEEEIDKALKLNPSYISIGPIFPTTSKNLPYETHGIDGFVKWRKQLNIPLVALAGITLENGKGLIKTGANGIAVMSDIIENGTINKDRVREWLDLFEKYSNKKIIN